jgi:putative hemolysin
MDAPLIEIICVLLLILANACLALSEISIVSSRKARLKSMLEAGNSRAGVALHLAENSNDFLSALQIGVTLIGVMAGAVGGATISDDLEKIMITVPFLVPYAKPLSIFIVVSLITLLSLILGELIPKRIGLSNPEKFACIVAPGVKLLCTISAPGVRLLTASTGAVLDTFGVEETAPAPVSQEEIRILVDESTKAGVFEASERDVVSEALRLADRSVKDIMTHRRKVTWLNLLDPFETNLRKMKSTGHIWFPVAEGSLDKIVGILNAKEVLTAVLDRKEVQLSDFVKTPNIVPDKNSALDALDKFKQSHIHTAIVCDEYGGVQGVLSLTDLLEAIVGEIPTLEDHTIFNFIRRKDDSFLLDGVAHISQVESLLQTRLSTSGDTDYKTLAGFMLSHLGNIPTSGQFFTHHGYRFEVLDMDRNRIDKILVKKEDPTES